MAATIAAAQRHPRRVAAGVLALLGSFAVTAFSVAPMAPDAAKLPVTLVTEELAVPGLAQQASALAEHELQLNRAGLSRNSDTADSLLRRLGVADPLAASFLRQDRDARLLIDGRGGKQVQVLTAPDGTLLELLARFQATDPTQAKTHFSRLKITREDGSFTSQVETVPLVAQTRLGNATVRTTIWAATEDARLPEAVAGQLIEIFSADFDFHRQLKRGASFSVVYETLTADDQPVTWGESTGRILAAEFINRGKAYQAMWFPGVAGLGSYYGFDGKSRRHQFLASPVEFSRVTSDFGMRIHPLANNWRQHNGVDYSAPLGTPVMSVGDGVVEFAGRQSGYGNVVTVRHDKDKTTLYAHLNQIDVQEGQRVEQGQVVGQVGATGWATGPHLHFEFRVDGQVQDPEQLAGLANTASLDAQGRQRFEQVAAVTRQQLQAAQSMVRFRGDAE